jgi:NIPSNAP
MSFTLCIRYTLDPQKLRDFEAYVARLPEQITRAGGAYLGYYLPTKFAGPTNTALGLVGFDSLAAYEAYRAKLAADPDAVENVSRMEASGCVLVEDRSFLRRHPQSA